MHLTIIIDTKGERTRADGKTTEAAWLRRRRTTVRMAVAKTNAGRVLPTRAQVLATATAKSAATWTPDLQAAEEEFLKRGQKRKALAVVNEVLLTSEMDDTTMQNARVELKKRKDADTHFSRVMYGGFFL